jgi:hypothetical protein
VFGSQVVETAIGLALLFFVVSTGASTIVEIISRLLGKRAVDLERVLGALLAGSDSPDVDLQRAVAAFKGTSVYDAARAGDGRTLFRKRLKQPSYLSAKAFADAVVEMLVDESDFLVSMDSLPQGLRRRLTAIVRHSRDDLAAIKAHLEGQFDETMERAAGAYKRWALLVLAGVSLFIAVSGNVSTLSVAECLWKDTVIRQTVVNAAGGLIQPSAPGQPSAPDVGALASVANTTDRLEELRLPVGWTDDERRVWWPLHWDPQLVVMVTGWVMTALFAMFGGPFWFDLLTRLVSLRSTGGRPSAAVRDPLSATAQVRRTRETATGPERRSPDSGPVPGDGEPASVEAGDAESASEPGPRHAGAVPAQVERDLAKALGVALR